MSFPMNASPVTELGIGLPLYPDHEVPFHLAIRLVAMPPAVVKSPATMTSSPRTTIALTREFPPVIPVPSAAQFVPFQTAMPLAETPPMFENAPPAYTLPPATAIA